MTTRIDVFDENDFRSAVADWVELHTLIATDGSYTSSDVARARTVLEDADHGSDDYDQLLDEPVDTEIADLESESNLIDVYEELRLRQTNLGELYPFDLSVSGVSWRLERRQSVVDRRASAGRVSYLACLIASAIRNKTILRDDANFDALCKGSPRVVQALSVVASAEIVNGTSYWFGWPRPDHTGKMRTALDELINRVGYGKLKGNDPAWTTGREKDGTIDLIAWHHFQDGTWSHAALIGQVASGMNWRTKPVSSYIRGHFLDWFEDPLVEPWMGAIGAIFIPYPLHHDSRADSHDNFETVAHDTARRDYRNLGVIVDRLRMVRLVADRYSRYPQDPYIVLARNEVPKWVSRARAYLRGEPVTA